MDREKSIFEQMGGTYTEKDGILYPNIRVEQEETEAEQDIFSGKYGDLWKKYMKENQSDRYYDLIRTGQLKQKAAEVNEEANELLDRIMQQYLQKQIWEPFYSSRDQTVYVGERAEKGGVSFYEAFDHFQADHDVSENDKEIF